MLECTKKEHESAVAQTYKFLCNLLTGDQQAQWGCNCHEMHDCNAWAGLNGEKHKSKRQYAWALFKDCLELHKLTIFSTDAAKRQKFYIQQGVQKTQQAFLCQYVSCIEVLNRYLKHLPTLKNSPKAVLTTKGEYSLQQG